MRTVLVDDELWALEELAEIAEELEGVEIVGKFQHSSKALEFILENHVDCVLSDIEMPGMDGIDLGREIRKHDEKIVLIYITGYDQYIKDAMLSVKADYYILKPFDKEEVINAYERGKLLQRRQRKKIYFRTFGYFEVLVEGKTVPFSNSKAKELLALCVHHKGGVVSIQEATSLLWEGRPYDRNVKSLYRKAVISIRQELEKHGVEYVFKNIRGGCMIDATKVSCDYYEYLGGNREVRFRGEYLSDYYWAEETVAQLSWKENFF